MWSVAFKGASKKREKVKTATTDRPIYQIQFFSVPIMVLHRVCLCLFMFSYLLSWEQLAMQLKAVKTTFPSRHCFIYTSHNPLRSSITETRSEEATPCRSRGEIGP